MVKEERERGEILERESMGKKMRERDVRETGL